MNLGKLAALGIVLVSSAWFGIGVAHAETVTPMDLRYQQQLYGGFRTVGNAVLVCPPADAVCAAASQRGNTHNNNEYDMGYTNTPGLGVRNSSSATFTVPAGATVDYARLYWGANTGKLLRFGSQLVDACDTAGVATSPAGTPADTSPRVRLGAAAPVDVPPLNVAETPAARGGPHYYTAEGDVTALIRTATPGAAATLTVADVWAPTGRGCIGGWGLTFVYKYPGPDPVNAPTRQEISIFSGHVFQGSTDAPTGATVSGFRAYAAGARAGVIAYEGDYGAPGDKLAVNGQNLPQPHTGGTNNFFVSAADGAVAPALPNNFSINAEAFDLPAAAIPAGSTSATLTASTKGDTYLIQQFVLAVPIPDITITKTATPPDPHPGDTVRYTAKVANEGPLDYPDAKFSDDLTANLDDGTYNADASADGGTVSYARPKISWRGSVPAGRTFTVSYSFTVADPPTGDGALLNAIVADPGQPRVDCAAGSPDPGCAANLTITAAPPASAPGSAAAPAAHVSPIPAAGPLADTGAPAVLLAAIGAALVGAGVLLRRGCARRA